MIFMLKLQKSQNCHQKRQSLPVVTTDFFQTVLIIYFQSEGENQKKNLTFEDYKKLGGADSFSRVKSD